MNKWMSALCLVIVFTTVAAQPQGKSAPAPRRSQPASGGNGGGSTITTSTPGMLCFAGCPTTSMTLLFVNSEGRCSVPVRYSCFPYRCDTTLHACQTACVSSADCASGAGCDLAQAECAPMSYQCSNAWDVRAADGTTNSCSPYRCTSGACQSTCSGDIDCADPTRCSNGRCLLPPGPPIRIKK